MIMVIILFPVSLFAREIGNVLFSPEKIISIVNENVIDQDVLASVAEDSIRNVMFLGNEGPFDNVLLQAFQGLSHQDWVTLLGLVAPPEVAKQSIFDVVEGYYGWIDSDDAYPKVTLDTNPWRENMVKNSVEIAEIIMGSLDACTTEELNLFASADLGSSQAIPVCRPPEPYYSAIIEKVAEVGPSSMGSLVERIDFTGSDNINGDKMLAAKQMVRKTRFYLNKSWIFVLGLFLLGVLMGSRTLAQFFRWFGLPLLFSGLILLILDLLLIIFSEGVVGMLWSVLGQGIPGGIVFPLQAALSEGVSMITRPALFTAVTMIVLGAGSFLGGALLQKLQTRPKEGSPAKIYAKPAPPKENINEDDTPSGMFG